MYRKFKYSLIILILFFELFYCDSKIALTQAEHVVSENEFLDRLIIAKLIKSQNTAFIDEPVEKSDLGPRLEELPGKPAARGRRSRQLQRRLLHQQH